VNSTNIFYCENISYSITLTDNKLN